MGPPCLTPPQLHLHQEYCVSELLASSLLHPGNVFLTDHDSFGPLGHSVRIKKNPRLCLHANGISGAAPLIMQACREWQTERSCRRYWQLCF